MTLRGGVPAAGSPESWSQERLANPKLDPLTASFAHTVDCQVAMLFQRDRKRRSPIVVSSWGLAAPGNSATRPRKGGFVDRALGAKRPVVGPIYPLLDLGLVHIHVPPLCHAVAAPVRAEAGVQGALVGGFVSEPAHRSWTTWTAESYAALFALYLNAPRALEGLLTELRTDRNTRCLTYDGIRLELAREINRSTRARRALSCCFIHLGRLERPARESGREARDEIPGVVDMTLLGGVRSCDTVGHDSDDLFVAILPETVERDARQLAERLRTLVTAQEVVGIDGPRIGIGVATWNHGESAEELLARAADDLLGEALTRSSPNGNSSGARATNGSSPAPLRRVDGASS